MRNITVHYGSGKVSQEITIGPHRLTADVGPDLGGADEGPSPHEFLAASLGSCTAMTLKMYAAKKSWPLENVEVLVTLDSDPEKTLITRKISLIGSLTQEQKDRLMDIANHCPVHKTLSGKIEIQTS